MLGLAYGAQGCRGAKSGPKWKARGPQGSGANALIPGPAGPVLDLPTNLFIFFSKILFTSFFRT